MRLYRITYSFLRWPKLVAHVVVDPDVTLDRVAQLGRVAVQECVAADPFSPQDMEAEIHAEVLSLELVDANAIVGDED
jgi:hypothetical protein